MKTDHYSIKEIAQELELSRNTVAKVLNGKPGVSQKTVNRVKNFLGNRPKKETQSDEDSKHQASNSRVEKPKSVVFTYFQSITEYQNNILTGVERVMKEKGYLLLLNIIRSDDGSHVELPNEIKNHLADGIISFNVFDECYWEDIIASGTPAVFIDAMCHPYKFTSRTDIISPENTGPMYNLVNMLVASGKTKFGYAGNYKLCYSPYQRWKSVKYALQEHGLQLEERFCLYDDESAPPQKEQLLKLKKRLNNMEELPEVIICNSDIHAILLSRALQEMNIRVPEEVAIVGYDNISETLRQTPTITTVDAHSEYLGKLAARRLISRIENPELPYAFIQNQTDIILRKSTEINN